MLPISLHRAPCGCWRALAARLGKSLSLRCASRAHLKPALKCSARVMSRANSPVHLCDTYCTRNHSSASFCLQLAERLAPFSGISLRVSSRRANEAFIAAGSPQLCAHILRTPAAELLCHSTDFLVPLPFFPQCVVGHKQSVTRFVQIPICALFAIVPFCTIGACVLHFGKLIFTYSIDTYVL